MSHIIIEGNLGAEPNYVVKGESQRLELFILENKRKKNEETGLFENAGTLPHNVTLFGKRADIFKDNLSKGMSVVVVGELQPNSYVKEGETIEGQSIIANSVSVVPMGVTIVRTPKQDNADFSQQQTGMPANEEPAF